MDTQGQFNVAHLLGSTVDVAHYSTLQHPLQGYGGTIATMSGPQGAGPVPPAATITLGYSISHPHQSAAAPPHSVAQTPQVSAHPQIQYYYEAAESLAPHPQVRYDTTAPLGLHPPAAQPSPVPRYKTEAANLNHQTQGNKGMKKRVPRTEGTSAKLSRKHCRNRGEAYISASGKFVPAKQYVEQDCQCRNQCLTKLGTVADREGIFRRFWDIGDFGRQNAHLAQSVVMVPSSGGGSNKRRVDPPMDEKHLKTVRRIYYVKLKEDQTRVRVCKSQFLRLYGVSNGRLDRVLQALHCEHPHALQDRRGQHTPSNKTAQEDLELVTQHIHKLQQQRAGIFDEAPTQGVTEKISVKKMHELYRWWCEEQGKTPVSLWVYRQVKTRLIPQQEKKNLKTGKMSNSFPARHLVMHQPCRNKDVTIGCQEVQEAVVGPRDTAINTDVYKDSIVSTTLSKPATISTSITTITNDTTTFKPSTTSTTNTATIPTSVTTSAITVFTSTPTTITITPATTITTITPAATTTTMTSVTTATALEAPQQKMRRKQRQSHQQNLSMTREERKACRNKGEAYITSNGKLQCRKVYQDVPCECRHRCIPALGTPETRRQVFDSFWGLASFTRQNTYIAHMVTLAPLSQRRTGATPSRTYSRVYSVQLKDGDEMVRVCKLAFLRLHGISNGRVDRVLQAVACQSPFALKDRRGRHSPINKTQEQDVNYALSHMCTFPLKDPSQPDGCCLPQDLNVEKMYRLYREQCALEGRKPVGSFVYRKILKERFNCHVKTPYNRTPESDLDFARQYIQSCEVAVLRGGEGSLVGASVKGLHQEYVKKCTQEGRKPVGIDVFRKLCQSRVPTKAKL